MLTRRHLLLNGGAGLAALALPVAGAAAAGKVYRVPVDLASRRLLVSCTIEGNGPFALGIDTGGVVSMIEADLAARLGLKQRGMTPLGIAGKHDRYPMFEAREVVFGSTFRQERVLLAGVSGRGFGPGVSGMLAAGCLTTTDAELDFSALEWRLMPGGGPARPGWSAHERAIRPTRIGSPHLFGQASLGGQDLRCLLDTGAPTPTILRPKAARRAGIGLDAQNWSPSQMNGDDARVYRSKTPLLVGGLAIQRPLITVSEDAPAFTDDGIIGLPILQQLNLATDVDAGRLWTRPSGRPPEPQRYNLSGLWVDQKGGQPVAGRVGRGSPAERAGIAPGDRIEGLPFGALVARLNGRPGDRIVLGIAHKEARREVTLVLADYL